MSETSMSFSPEAIRQYEETVTRYPVPEAALIPVLHIAQEEFGFLSIEAMNYVADLMKLPRARVYGVATFYTLLNKEPVGKYHLQVCTNISCMLLGSERIVDHIRKRLKIEMGETTPDGLFTLTEVECLASCGTAPMMQVNHTYCENLTAEVVDRILDSLAEHGVLPKGASPWQEDGSSSNGGP